jgi:hypothetical protein
MTRALVIAGHSAFAAGCAGHILVNADPRVGHDFAADCIQR